jgi:hypothetical protein
MASRKSRRNDRDESTLPFDVTQEIDPSLADQLRRTSEPTLTQGDFEDITVVLPPKPKPKPRS